MTRDLQKGMEATLKAAPVVPVMVIKSLPKLCRWRGRW